MKNSVINSAYSARRMVFSTRTGHTEREKIQASPCRACKISGHVSRPLLCFVTTMSKETVKWLELSGEEVVIHPDVVMTEDLCHPPVKPLLSLGEPQRNANLDSAELGISRNDVPALIRMATDYQLHDGPQDSP